jgi:predicted transcriptional regulator
MFQGQSKTIAKMLAKAFSEHNNISINENSARLINIRTRIEELMWVLNEKNMSSNPLLEVCSINMLGKEKESLTVGQIMEKLKIGELSMNDLPADVVNKIRKAALELKRLHQKQL